MKPFTTPSTSAKYRLASALLMLVTGITAHAKQGSQAPVLPQYQQECSSCHIAFAPGLLPAVSWKRLMATLPRHFGSDASLDPVATRTLAAWLEANAGTYKRVSAESPPEDRITRSPWFNREHREVSAAVWKRPAIQSPTNCAACHPQADKGDFNEHSILIPR